jgi:hypothetical protein
VRKHWRDVHHHARFSPPPLFAPRPPPKKKNTHTHTQKWPSHVEGLGWSEGWHHEVETSKQGVWAVVVVGREEAHAGPRTPPPTHTHTHTHPIGCTGGGARVLSWIHPPPHTHTSMHGGGQSVVVEGCNPHTFWYDSAEDRRRSVRGGPAQVASPLAARASIRAATQSSGEEGKMPCDSCLPNRASAPAKHTAKHTGRGTLGGGKR